MGAYCRQHVVINIFIDVPRTYGNVNINSMPPSNRRPLAVIYQLLLLVNIYDTKSLCLISDMQ